jgi:ankyrin repeat protein
MHAVKFSGFLLVCLSVLAHAATADLESAVRAGDLTRIEGLLAAGTDPDGVSDSGTPVLVLAASNGNEEVVRMLIAAGANPDARTRGEMTATAMMFASGGDNSGILEVLLDAGADVDLRDAMGDPAINWAAYFGNTSYVEVLLAAGADTSLRGHGNAFEIAVRRGHEDIVRLTAASTGNAPPESGSIERVVRTLWAGDDRAATAMILELPDSETVPVDAYGRPLVHIAAINNAPLAIEALTRRYGNVDAPDVIDFTALMHAAREGNKPAAERLLDLGANVNHAAAETGLSLTPLHLAAIGGDTDMVSLLFDAGAGLDLQGRDGATALLWAMYENQQAAATVLVEAGADVDLAAKSGQSPRSIVASMGWDDLAALIEKRGTH